MIVVDASAVLDLLRGPGSPAADRLASAIRQREVLAAPHLLDAEVGQALRRWVIAGRVVVERGSAMLAAYRDLDIRRHATTANLAHAWRLRDNVSFYDALYLALAEGLACPLVTADQRLADIPGSGADVEVVDARP